MCLQLALFYEILSRFGTVGKQYYLNNLFSKGVCNYGTDPALKNHAN
jgi:hypothetical protein